MNRRIFSHGGNNGGMPDPAFAAALSVVPGLGQFYNGESRKGWLFFDVGVLNLLLIGFVVSANPLAQSLVAFARDHHFQANESVVRTLESMHLGTPAANSLLMVCLLFIMYSVRDAYDRAIVKRRNHIYPDAVVELSEAASGSYLVHFAMLMTFVFMAAFLFIPRPQRAQVTEIEFVINQKTNETKTVDSRRIAPNASISSGKHDRQKPVNTGRSQPQQATSATKAQAQEAAKPVKSSRQAISDLAQALQPSAPPAVKPFMPAISKQPPALPSPPVPTQTKGPAAIVPFPAPPVVVPKVELPASANLPLAAVSVRQAQGPAAAPLLAQAVIPASGGAPSFARGENTSARAGTGQPSAPLPVKALGEGPSGHKPSIVSGSETGSGRKGPAVEGPKPEAARPSNGAGGPPTIAVLPRLASPPGAGEDGAANADKDGKPGVTSTGARPVHFGEYLAYLQRRIKQGWFPPSHNSSQRTMIRFQIGNRGDLRHATITRSSGVSAIDNAAMRAIRSAAPFKPLPDGAPDDIDVEFTFDYNVFGGRGGF